MLKLQAAPTFSAPVSIPTPSGQKAQIVCEFRWMATKKLTAFLGEAAAVTSPRSRWVRFTQALLALLARLPVVGAWARARVLPVRTEFDYLNDIVVGWSGVDLPWGREAFDRLCEQYPAAPALIVEAWAVNLAENRLGN